MPIDSVAALESVQKRRIRGPHAFLKVKIVDKIAIRVRRLVLEKILGASVPQDKMRVKITEVACVSLSLSNIV